MTIYKGQAHLQDRKRRRAWFYEVCWELVGTLLLLAGFWAFIIFMFVMGE